MKRLPVKLQHETLEQQLAGKRYNPALGFFYKKLWVSIKSGTGDEVTVWSDKVTLYVLSTSARYGYAGLVTYYEDHVGVDKRGRDKRGIVEEHDTFTQNATEEIREDFFDLSPATQRKLLEEYL